MEYVSHRDYEYIINKYHDTTKPYDIMQRFVRHDAIFDESTGLDGDEIKALHRPEEHTSELQSRHIISYDVFCL